MDAALGGDLQELLRILAPDVTLWTDGGGKGPATSLRPVHGSVAVAKLLVAVAANVPGSAVVRYRRVNGDPSALVFTGDSPLAVLVLDLTPDGHRVRGVYSVTNPTSWRESHATRCRDARATHSLSSTAGRSGDRSGPAGPGPRGTRSRPGWRVWSGRARAR